MVKVLIWPGHHDWLDFAIKFFTHGRGSHAAFLRGDGRTVHEAFLPSLRDRPFTTADRESVEIYEIEGLSGTQSDLLERRFDYNLGLNIRYSIGDLFRYAFNAPNKNEHRTFCSRYVMRCLEGVLPKSQWPLVRLPLHDWASPRDLRISPRLHLVHGPGI
jgi:hypothetical protein